jgi:hypothetical protein
MGIGSQTLKPQALISSPSPRLIKKRKASLDGCIKAAEKKPKPQREFAWMGCIVRRAAADQ